MPSASVALTPGLSSFLKTLKTNPVDTSIDNLISLLKRRQIRQPHFCAVATAYLLLRVVSAFRTVDAAKLIDRVQNVGRRLVAARPREMVVGNIVRRVLGVIRDEAEDGRDTEHSVLADASSDIGSHTPQDAEGQSPERLGLPGHGISSPVHRSSIGAKDTDPATEAYEREVRSAPLHSTESSSSRPPVLLANSPFAPTPAAPVMSMFSLLSYPPVEAPRPSPPTDTSSLDRLARHGGLARDLWAEVIDGISEIIDELGQVDDQIAAYALEHIHSNEVILTHSSSVTVQKFLLKAAVKRKFTVIHAESYPNHHNETHAIVAGSLSGDEELSTDSFQKPLTTLGITVILIPDSAVFALMSRVNKVILGTHSVLANGGLVAAAGTRTIAHAAKVHHIPVVVVSGVYKLSPVYPFDFEALIEYGDSSKVLAYEDGDLVDKIDVENPLYDYVPAELVDLYITNLGGHAPSYLYRIVSDHYRKEDISL